MWKPDVQQYKVQFNFFFIQRNFIENEKMRVGGYRKYANKSH